MPSAVGFSFSPSFAFIFSFSSLDVGGTEDRAELVCAEPCNGGGASCGLGDRRCTGGGTEVDAEVEGTLAGDKKGSPRETVSVSVLAGVDSCLAWEEGSSNSGGGPSCTPVISPPQEILRNRSESYLRSVNTRH